MTITKQYARGRKIFLQGWVFLLGISTLSRVEAFLVVPQLFGPFRHATPTHPPGPQVHPQPCRHHNSRSQSQLFFSQRTTEVNGSPLKAASLPNPSTDTSATSDSDSSTSTSKRLEDAFETMNCPNTVLEKLQAIGLLAAGQGVVGIIAQYMGDVLDLPNDGWGPGYGWTTPAILQGLVVGVLLRILLKTMEGLDSEHAEDLVMVPRASLMTAFRTNIPVWLGLLGAVVLGASAGISEEWLFRGVGQTAVYNVLGGGEGGQFHHAFSWLTSILSVSTLFGYLHRVTPVYFVVASLASVVWGVSFGWGDMEHANLVVPVVAHVIYDVLAALEAMWQLNHMTEEEQCKVMEWIQRQTQMMGTDV